MLGIRPAVPGDDIAKYAGVVVESLSDVPANGRLPMDGSLVSIATFPNLFNKYGHLFTSGSYAGNGSEGAYFKLPMSGNRMLKPREDGSVVGALSNDKTVQHTHVVSGGGGFHGNHQLQNTPVWNGPIGFTHPYHDDPNNSTARGVRKLTTYVSDTAPDHTHPFTLGSSAGLETRPFTMGIPTYLITGERSENCVAIIYGKDWTTTPGFNEVIAAKSGIEAQFARWNIHTYRIRHPEVAGSPTVDTAHVEVARQLQKLRTMYKKVWIMGIGTGAHLGAMAMTLPNTLWVANKFVGINGIYNLSGAMSAGMTAAMTNYLGGSTQALKDKGTPIVPYYPARLYHGANNAAIPTSQSVGFFPAATVVANLPQDANPVNYGMMDDIITFFTS